MIDEPLQKSLGIKFILEGTYYTVYIISDAQEFLEELYQEPSKSSKLSSMLTNLVERPYWNNDERNKNVGDGIYELKTSGSVVIRVFYFFDGKDNDKGVIIITHVWEKGKTGGKKAQDREIEKARKIKQAYLEQKRGEIK